VLNLIVEGYANKEGAYRLGIAKRTFEVHRARIMDKFGARNAADLPSPPARALQIHEGQRFGARTPRLTGDSLGFRRPSMTNR